MCLFNFPNRKSAKAKEKGILEFDCGSCPECLQKKSRLWALRASMESLVSPGVMVTLTYDTYKYLYGKPTAEENPTDSSIPLSKRDCQLFIKRLRKHFSDVKIKYILTAERGKRTGRAHYHALLFGVVFDDLIKYKKSDRGNWIYKSKTLEKIWQKGICTVDCINLNAKVARYCTKYCCKDAGVDDTFMLFSRGIGNEMLMKKFNGRSYWIEGREYSIPKQVWQQYIESKYNMIGYSRYIPKKHLENAEKKIYHALDYNERHVPHWKEREAYYNAKIDFRLSNYPKFRKKAREFAYIKALSSLRRKRDKYSSLINSAELAEKNVFKFDLQKLMMTCLSHERGRKRNEYYQYVRDNDVVYKRYLAYWKNKANVYKLTLPDVATRILALPDSKYRSYKTKSIKAFHSKVKGFDFIPPRSNCHGFDKYYVKPKYEEKTFAPLSRHYRANDTISKKYKDEIALLRNLRRYFIPQRYKLSREDWSYTCENPFIVLLQSRASTQGSLLTCNKSLSDGLYSDIQY